MDKFDDLASYDPPCKNDGELKGQFDTGTKEFHVQGNLEHCRMCLVPENCERQLRFDIGQTYNITNIKVTEIVGSDATMH